MILDIVIALVIFFYVIPPVFEAVFDGIAWLTDLPFRVIERWSK